MASMTLALPQDLQVWLEAQSQQAGFAESQDYVCDLLRREQEKQAKIKALREKIDEGLASGVSDKSMEEIKQIAIERAKERGLL